MPLDYADQRCVPYFRDRIDAKNVCNSYPGQCKGVVKRKCKKKNDNIKRFFNFSVSRFLTRNLFFSNILSSKGGNYYELRGGKACPKLKGGDPWNKPYGNQYSHGK